MHLEHPIIQHTAFPSTSSNMLWNAQHVSQTLSGSVTPCIRMPDFKIRQRPFSIPKVHSTSFLSDSSHSDHLSYCSVSGFGGPIFPIASSLYPWLMQSILLSKMKSIVSIPRHSYQLSHFKLHPFAVAVYIVILLSFTNNYHDTTINNSTSDANDICDGDIILGLRSIIIAILVK